MEDGVAMVTLHQDDGYGGEFPFTQRGAVWEVSL
jgi:hypothetical protein